MDQDTSLSKIITSPRPAAIEVTITSFQPRSWAARPASQPCTVSSTIATTSPTLAAVRSAAPASFVSTTASSGR